MEKTQKKEHELLCVLLVGIRYNRNCANILPLERYAASDSETNVNQLSIGDLSSKSESTKMKTYII